MLFPLNYVIASYFSLYLTIYPFYCLIFFFFLPSAFHQMLELFVCLSSHIHLSPLKPGSVKGSFLNLLKHLFQYLVAETLRRKC